MARAAPHPDVTSTDPAELAALARAHAGRCDQMALYLAGLAGMHAGRRGAEPDDCPFEDARMREQWLWYRRMAISARADIKASATKDLLETFNLRPATP